MLDIQSGMYAFVPNCGGSDRDCMRHVNASTKETKQETDAALKDSSGALQSNGEVWTDVQAEGLRIDGTDEFGLTCMEAASERLRAAPAGSCTATRYCGKYPKAGFPGWIEQQPMSSANVTQDSREMYPTDTPNRYEIVEGSQSEHSVKTLEPVSESSILTLIKTAYQHPVYAAEDLDGIREARVDDTHGARSIFWISPHMLNSSGKEQQAPDWQSQRGQQITHSEDRNSPEKKQNSRESDDLHRQRAPEETSPTLDFNFARLKKAGASLDRCLRNVFSTPTLRYCARRLYAIDVQGYQNNDYFQIQHVNGLVIVGLARTHAVLHDVISAAQGCPLHKLLFEDTTAVQHTPSLDVCRCGVSRTLINVLFHEYHEKNVVRGKRKRGALKLTPNMVIGSVRRYTDKCQGTPISGEPALETRPALSEPDVDTKSFQLFPCVEGRLIEINHRIVRSMEPFRSSVEEDSWILVSMPHARRGKSRGVVEWISEEDYRASRKKELERMTSAQLVLPLLGSSAAAAQPKSATIANCQPSSFIQCASAEQKKAADFLPLRGGSQSEGAVLPPHSAQLRGEPITAVAPTSAATFDPSSSSARCRPLDDYAEKNTGGPTSTATSEPRRGFRNPLLKKQ